MSHRWKCVVRTEFRDSVCFYLRHDTGEDPSTGEGYVPLTHVTFPLSPFPGHSRVVHLELEPSLQAGGLFQLDDAARRLCLLFLFV